jgi:ubiquinone/menaquinone biosynthesis C-methylase UbiE
MHTTPRTHADQVHDQFTRQADLFAAFPIHSQGESLAWLAEELRVSGRDRILDAGCGPGLVACHLAPMVATVVGIDATPAMVSKARSLAAARQCLNATFREGLMERLPFPEAAFDGVVTRYTFHHLLDPRAALADLIRVCRPGGRVVVCDSAPRPGCRDAYDSWERMRDPSHTSALTPDELHALALESLTDVSIRAFRLETDVAELIASSFPGPGDAEILTHRMHADIGFDRLDLGARLVAGRLRMSFPIVLVAGTVHR